MWLIYAAIMANLRAGEGKMVPPYIGTKTPVDGWQGAPSPRDTSGELTLSGRHVACVPFRTQAQAAELLAATDGRHDLWTYMPWGPFETAEALAALIAGFQADPAWFYFAITDPASGRVIGKAAYLRIAPDHGSIEVGGILFAPTLQRSPAATEAMVLMMRWAFAHGYRRYEWKCDAANLPSRRAAQRLGFSYEGVFRQHQVVKGLNRDTAWFAITDQDWPALNAAYDAWLAPENFDAQGQQITPLGQLTTPVRVSSDPALG